MKKIYSKILFVLLFLSLAVPQVTVQADPQVTGGVNVFTSPPELVCVGDSFTSEGAAGTTYPDMPKDVPLAPLMVTSVQITALHGKVTPSTISQDNDFYYFNFTYTATSVGAEVITLNLNNGLATYQEKFNVQKSCDYDAFLLSVLNFSTQQSGADFRSITRVTGMGTMKRLRTGELYLQGNGKWDFEENILTAPPDCVEWYIPPLIASGPFDLDGKLDEEGESVDTILQFQPSGKPVYHGISTCTYADGSTGQGWGMAMGGDPDLAAKIQTTFPSAGGTNQVELTGGGIKIVQSAGDLEYFAQLTLIPR
ncbi:MAG: hypothetical protein P4L50_30220 [Anaerolineaceae bacterium]|nr:hypothetical protein [Anaerolineaceae bacterium]